MAKLVSVSSIFLLLQIVLISADFIFPSFPNLPIFPSFPNEAPNRVDHPKCPGQFKKSGVAHKADSHKILDIHNNLRSKLVHGEVPNQPRASKESMKKMVWNKQLADLALDVANTCKLEHIDQSTREQFTAAFTKLTFAITDDEYATLGQNIYESCTSYDHGSVHWEHAINDWFHEHNSYTYSRYERSRDSFVIGHYTQVVWGDTYEVGCAYSKYRQDAMHCTMIVCNYGPPGNVRGQYPYKRAEIF